MGHAAEQNDPQVSSADAETNRLLDSLRAKGYRVGGVQVVFGIGDSPGRIRYVVNGTPLDSDELRALDAGRLKLASPPRSEDHRRRDFPAPPKP
jgi:hypothetical protein